MQNRYSKNLLPLPLPQHSLFVVEIREFKGNKNSKKTSQRHTTATQVGIDLL